MDNNSMSKTSSSVRQSAKGLVEGRTVRFLDFSKYHGKEPQGSTKIRVEQLIKYWPEAKRYRYGENPDVMIFQKVYCGPDYKFPAHFEGIKILDICDPDWLEQAQIVETAISMDAITCPTEPLAEFMRQFHDNVVVVPDRFDIEVIPEPKQHIEAAKTVAWFGYSHNAELIKPAMRLLDELNLNLIMISNDDTFPHQWSKRKYQEFYTYKKYEEETIYKYLQMADFVILPEGFRPQDKFKSNNKTVKANLAGLPVAKDGDEVRLYMEPQARRKWFDDNYATIKEEYDVRKSIDQYKEIIKKIQESG